MLLQAWARENGKPVARFVVTGGSKRGWTTWLTGAVDDRVIAIAPMVIVMLNLGPQGPNQLKVWGKYSEQIHDYVERGLMETVATPDRHETLEDGRPVHLPRAADEAQDADQRRQRPLLDAQCARPLLERAARAEVPDRAAQRRPRPEGQPRLGDLRAWGLSSITSCSNRPMPQLTWDFAEGAGGDYHFTIRANPAPQAARIWTARSEQPRLPRVEVGISAA